MASSTSSSTIIRRPQAYVLRNSVTHGRFLPSAHSFEYPTLSLLVSLSALESHQLDLANGWVFGYGSLLGRITALRAAKYLRDGEGSIRRKLEDVLRDRGFLTGKKELQDAWMMTMPSFMGFEGINPLTVYYCYDSDGELWLTVLEIHNTFGETHVHVLEIGKNEETPSRGYDHQWTFPREFHVSPFNDRSGFYTISIKRPSHSPMRDYSPSDSSPPRPAVRVRLYTSPSDADSKVGPLKLSALLRPTKSTPLTTSSLLLAIAELPFGLFLSFARILYHAWILHYVKRLDVFVKPDPLPVTMAIDAPTGGLINGLPGGIKWLEESMLDAFARRRVERFLQKRTYEVGIEVVLVAADPKIPVKSFTPTTISDPSRLTITYRSSKFFTFLFISPTAEHLLLLGCDVDPAEKVFSISDSSRDLFLSLFSSPSAISKPSFLQNLRCQPLPSTLKTYDVPSRHYLDEPGFLAFVCAVGVIYAHRMLDAMEKWIFRLIGARYVEGHEPWTMWERAASRRAGTRQIPARIGSVRRD